MQLGFVLDQSRCIGCHACTVACKSENDVPLGNFRTWVKYTETGAFPEVRRNFTVLRCNQCSNAPCVKICPVNALEKRADGIVDVDHRTCIGCKSCMHACPYDALYINDDTGTAEKCHFCAHRTERGLAPACAIVCPTEAIIPGDFHDPSSRVSKMRQEEDLRARKVEAGTGPNVWYRAAHASGLDPQASNAAGGWLWSNQLPTPQLEAQEWEAMQEKAKDENASRTVYDVGHPALWGGKVTNYLFAKSLAAGVFLAGAFVMPPFHMLEGLSDRARAWVPAMGLLFLALTTVLLVADLKRPERFLLILKKPNWDSWLARGAVILMAYGLALVGWLGWSLWREPTGSWWERLACLFVVLLAALTACYTAWLFGQAHGRVLWMKRGLWLHLIVQAFVGGAALLLLLGHWIGLDLSALGTLRWLLLASLLAHLAWTLMEGHLSPARRQAEFERASRLLSHGPYAKRHWLLGVGAGILLPLLLNLLFVPPVLHPWGAALALFGLWIEEDLFVRGGQALPIS